MIHKPTRIISSDASIDDTWNAVKKYIEDKDALDELDEEFKLLDSDDDKEDWFDQEIFDYMNDVVAGDTNFIFGVHKKSEDLGFWNERDVDFGEGDEDFLDKAIKDYEKELHSNPQEDGSEVEEDPVPAQEGREEEKPKHVDAEIITDDEVPEHLKDKENSHARKTS